MYHTPEGRFKVFDSHAKDLFGTPHPQVTCVLLELETLNELINHFQALYAISNALFMHYPKYDTTHPFTVLIPQSVIMSPHTKEILQ